YSIMFLVAQIWINKIKDILKDRLVFNKPKWIFPAQILLLIIGISIWSLVCYALSYDLKGRIWSTPLAYKQWMTPEGHDVKFKIMGNGYFEVPIDNDDQILQIRGKYLTMNWYLFNYGFNESIDSMLMTRFSDVYKSEGGAKCYSE